jgi:hypothetical protein
VCVCVYVYVYIYGAFTVHTHAHGSPSNGTATNELKQIHSQLINDLDLEFIAHFLTKMMV